MPYMGKTREPIIALPPDERFEHPYLPSDDDFATGWMAAAQRLWQIGNHNIAEWLADIRPDTTGDFAAGWVAVVRKLREASLHGFADYLSGKRR